MDNGFPRPVVRGKFLYAGNEKFYVKGVTYGAFRPDASGKEFHDEAQIERDFKAMAAAGINVVRIPHTVPPASLLDIAQKHGLRVMIGLGAEQYVGYLIDKKGAPRIDLEIRKKISGITSHPALFAYALGNEIQAPVARWLGRRKIERYLKNLYKVVKAEDPGGLVTYVNFPTTEYVHLPFLDFQSFNVYLETQEKLETYLAKLQNLAGDSPLVLTEAGLDSMRNGFEAQSQSLAWQIRTSFAAGCAGIVIFSWTDEWFRAGAEVDDWAFGLTDKNRNPKPALETVKKAFKEIPFPENIAWPKISVIVCTYNGQRTVKSCMDGITELDYPNYEVIVINDGSRDKTASIVQNYPVKLISTENRGLSAARNTGLENAAGEIVAYIDDDAHPDQHWLKFLAMEYMKTPHMGVGGPNIPPLGAGMVSECVANAPGSAAHVLLNDRVAEHIPGCNMSFRAEALRAVGGFDPCYRTAGDDVDVCWKIQAKGWTIGFSPGAMVWHHRRNSVRAYWKQQIGYGKAEALLEQKWPDKYNVAGHVTWTGRIYSKGLTRWLGSAWRVYHGAWGASPFQSLYQVKPRGFMSFPLMPEWYWVILLLGGLSLLERFWKPMISFLPLFICAVGAPLVQAMTSAVKASIPSSHRGRWEILRLIGLTAFLHLLQPLARLWGRVTHGLTAWRKMGPRNLKLLIPWQDAAWTPHWKQPDERVRALQKSLLEKRMVVVSGGNYDSWDLEVRGGMCGGARILMAVEDHGGGCQYVRCRVWPKFRLVGLISSAIFAFLSIWAAFDQAWLAAIILFFMFELITLRLLNECTSSVSTLLAVIKDHFAEA